MIVVINLVSSHAKVLHFLQNTPAFTHYLGVKTRINKSFNPFYAVKSLIYQIKLVNLPQNLIS